MTDNKVQIRADSARPVYMYILAFNSENKCILYQPSDRLNYETKTIIVTSPWKIYRYKPRAEICYVYRETQTEIISPIFNSIAALDKWTKVHSISLFDSVHFLKRIYFPEEEAYVAGYSSSHASPTIFGLAVST